ncbi:MAG: hypothetical protein R3E83_15460 [Burkholderiaceae bacterium]
MHNKHRGHLFAWRLSGTASAPVFTPESGTSRSASQATKASCWRDPADESRGMLALLGRAYPQARIGVPFLERQTRADTAGESALEYAVVPASDDGQSITHLVCRMNTIGEHCQSSQGQPTE